MSDAPAQKAPQGKTTMADKANDNKILLLYPRASLVLQAAEWAQKHDRFAIRMASPAEVFGVQRALDDASAVIIDATESPDRALQAMELAVEKIGHRRLVVYTETILPQLQQSTQARGVSLLVGPMSPLEWDAALDPLRAPHSLTAAEVTPRPLPERFLNFRLRTAGRRSQALPPNGPPVFGVPPVRRSWQTAAVG